MLLSRIKDYLFPGPPNEINQKVQEMMAERNRQDNTLREKYSSSSHTVFKQVKERPMSGDEINQKVQEMMAERNRQDNTLREKYSSSHTVFKQVKERPMSGDEINQEVEDNILLRSYG